MIIYGVDTKPMIERPVLAHARDALGKAERFAQLSEQTSDDRFEGVIHGAYYAMFHAARAALLAVEGTASANHGQAVETLCTDGGAPKARPAKRATWPKALTQAHELRADADYGNRDLTDRAKRCGRRWAVPGACAGLVEERARA